MNYLPVLQQAVSYLESHLQDDVSYEDVANEVFLSPYHFMRIWKAVTGYTIDEYLRNRRLYLAATDLAANDGKVIDIAYRYGYETPESFAKAFKRFHGASPYEVRHNHAKIRPFLPLTISFVIKGGNQMEYTVETMPAFAVIGLEKRFAFDTSYKDIPQFWTDNLPHLCGSDSPLKAFVEKCKVGEYGVCINDGSKNDFAYLIAGEYHGETVPKGWKVIKIPEHTWVRFRCVGRMPGAMQAVNTRIWNEWLPQNPDYELAEGIDIEFYTAGDMDSPTYQSEIWIPVKKKA